MSFTLLNRIIKSLISFSLIIFLSILPCAGEANAGKTSMTGDFSKDTLVVSKNLKEIITMTSNDNESEINDKETVFLITDYISRYRNRSQVNQSVSFTKMQTALNALAGHYKTFPNRPVPEKLKNRLNDELTKVEELITSNS